MKYSSVNGCIIYYDSVLHKCVACEPTILFLLGVEAIISPLISNNSLIIPKNVTDINGNVSEVDIYNKTISYITNNFGTVKDNGNYLQYNCNGLKQFIYPASGTDTDRVVPVLFHNEDDESILNIDSNTSSKSHYDLIADRLCEILDDAGYDTKKSSYIDKSSVTDKDLIDEINRQNKEIYDTHNRKKLNSKLYKLLDYKSMYSYSLGVLYGCICLGYNDITIQTVDPSSWYIGKFSNLVTTAFKIFRFHFAHPIPRIDYDVKLFHKYKGTQVNKLWHFDSDEESYIKPDAISCDSLYIDNSTIIQNNILYSPSSNQYSLIGSKNWNNIDSSVVDSITKKGISSNSDKPIIRYIVNYPVVIRRAYLRCSGYLAPSNKERYFISEGLLGWTNFNESSYKNYSDQNPILTLNRLKFSNISSNSIKLARNKHNSQKINYYECYVNDDSDNRRSLYGLLYNIATSGGIISISDDTEFDEVVSDIEFKANYEFPIEPTGYTLTPYYNLSDKIDIYVCDSDNSMMWNGSLSPVPIVSFGYTVTESELLDSYIDTGVDTPSKFDLRFNNNLGYWSNEWDPKKWVHEISDDIFLRTTDISLYRGNDEILITAAYSSLRDEFIYIFNDKTNQYLSLLDRGFISSNSLQSIGITNYRCDIVEFDDFGNSLLDENGNPLVWYDNYKNLYWNGILNINRWQEDKPVKISGYAYISLNNELKQIYDDKDLHTICINGVVVTYTEFYSSPYNGVIRNKVKLFKDSYIECYYDDYIDKYCIPYITTEWVTRNDVSELGYRFVDGIATLFMGNSELSLVFDTDPTD